MVSPPISAASVIASSTSAPAGIGSMMEPTMVAAKIPVSRQPSGLTIAGLGTRYTTTQYTAARIAKPRSMRFRSCGFSSMGAEDRILPYFAPGVHQLGHLPQHTRVRRAGAAADQLE